MDGTLTFGSLFAGIGGFDLGFERAGLRCEWQVEIDDYANRVLAKHWPTVRRWRDVRDFPPTPVDAWRVDLICGGFPCQDISNAGKRAGLDGERSGLWTEFARIIGLVRPRFVVVENVAAILVRGVERVLGDLAANGYDAEWTLLPAYAFGAQHFRCRLFIVAFDRMADASQVGGRAVVEPRIFREQRLRTYPAYVGCENETRDILDGVPGADLWRSEPSVGRMANGIPSGLYRLRGLGNAVVPQVAEFIGRRLMEYAA